MTCTLNIAADLVGEVLKYKYVVYSPKVTHEDDCFECLPYISSGTNDPNRCLMIDPDFLHGMLSCLY